MRVITGTARGRKLGQLQGMDTRPTTDKVKESLFNIIQFEIEERSVLDLFGGTGQLGIEALSRGAERCTCLLYTSAFPFCGGPSAMRGPGWYCKRVSAVEDLDQEGWDRDK